MDIRQLHYFLTLCEEMNYTRAAQRLFLSRQALRQSISALEAEMCGPLFISAHHKLALTDRGMSLQRHAAPVVEQFQQMQAALRAEIQSAQPVRIGISVALVPDYLPGLETQLDKFRQQYPHVEMRFRLLDNDAVADGVEQGELDAGLVIDLGCAAPVLSSAAAKSAPEHPAPGTQLPFAGGNNFRELGGYRADEGKTVKWGQIYRGFSTGRLTTEADRARLDGLGLRLILDLRSGAEAAKLPDYVPDGARLVQICGLRDATGQEIDFSPNDIQRLVQSAPAGTNLTQLIYRQMLTGNKAFKELFRALEAGETPILFH